jgi:hypothetical protein
MTTGKNGSQEIETRIGTLEFTRGLNVVRAARDLPGRLGDALVRQHLRRFNGERGLHSEAACPIPLRLKSATRNSDGDYSIS